MGRKKHRFGVKPTRESGGRMGRLNQLNIKLAQLHAATARKSIYLCCRHILSFGNLQSRFRTHHPRAILFRQKRSIQGMIVMRVRHHNTTPGTGHIQTLEHFCGHCTNLGFINLQSGKSNFGQRLSREKTIHQPCALPIGPGHGRGSQKQGSHTAGRAWFQRFRQLDSGIRLQQENQSAQPQ